MKKSTKTALCAGLALVMGCFGLVGCGGETTVIDEYELSAYKGDAVDKKGNPYYNTSLFYTNSVQQGYADPQVLDNTAQDGYYYLFGSSGNFAAMRSKNLAEWENVGPTFMKKQQGDKSDDVEKSTWMHNWAPEVTYDPDTKLYYLFFSARPDVEDGEWNSADRTQNGVVTDRKGMIFNNYNMYVATSKSPTGPFMMVDFRDESSCGAESLHTYNTEPDKELTKEQVDSGEYAYVVKGEKYYEAAFPDPWAKFCLFSPDELSKVVQKNGIGAMGGKTIAAPDASYVATIDPHPFVDPVTKKKYLFFKSEDSGWNINIGVEMKDWLTPIWSTAKYITHSNFYTLDDWRNGVNRGVSYEITSCNEGPFVLHHKDKNGKDLYYFTYSANDYGSSEYQVGMAVSKTGPLGPYRKLTEAEGGLLLCSSSTDSDTVSGAGHHSFVTMGDQLFIVYHRHCDFVAGGDLRYTAIDEVKFITVSDKDGNDLEIPYVNGPTDSVQPLPEKYSGYKNVAPDATVTCTDTKAELEYLTDGLLSVHKVADEDFMSYIGETSIEKTSDITFTFDTPTSIRAIMVYNSVSRKSIFFDVSRIEVTDKNDKVRVIRDVKFDTDTYCTIGGQNNDTVMYVRSGAAAYAEFYDIEVKSVKLTVNVPAGQDDVRLSEIRILGKI